VEIDPFFFEFLLFFPDSHHFSLLYTHLSSPPEAVINLRGFSSWPFAGHKVKKCFLINGKDLISTTELV
jgi:hypothetical protein